MWREIKRDDLECYSFRHTSMGARSLSLFFDEKGQIPPVVTYRSRSNRHGDDCYEKERLEKAILAIHVDITNSGKDHSKIYIKEGAVISDELFKEIMLVLDYYEVPDHLVDLIVKHVKKQKQ